MIIIFISTNGYFQRFLMAIIDYHQIFLGANNVFCFKVWFGDVGRFSERYRGWQWSLSFIQLRYPEVSPVVSGGHAEQETERLIVAELKMILPYVNRHVHVAQLEVCSVCMSNWVCTIRESQIPIYQISLLKMYFLILNSYRRYLQLNINKNTTEILTFKNNK